MPTDRALYSLVISLSLLGCAQKDADSLPQEFVGPEPIEAENSRLQLTSDSASALVWLDKDDEDFSLKRVARLDSPLMGKDRLQATDIVLSHDLIFVSYNMAGESQKGAIDMIEAKKPEKLKLISEINFENFDANAIAINEKASRLYIVGASSESESAGFYSVGLEKSDFSDDQEFYSLPSFAGTDVQVKNDQLLVSFGDRGAVSLFDEASLQMIGSYDLEDVRSISFGDQNNFFALTGGEGLVYEFDESVSAQQKFSVDGARTPESKSTLEVQDNEALVSLNEAGWKLICVKNGEILWKEGPLGSVTNSATRMKNYIFTAEGENGVAVYQINNKKLNSCDLKSVKRIGSVSLGDSASANHVYYSDDHLFVATGLQGLQIFKVEW